MAREKFHERIGEIVYTFDDGTEIRSPIERMGIRDTGFTLVAILRGGSKDRPERLLEFHTREWRGFRAWTDAPKRHAGATYVTIHCPMAHFDALLALSYVLKIEQHEKGASSASQCHFKR